MFKLWRYFARRREVANACEAHEWGKALYLAKQYGFERKWIALARITQLLNEVSNG